LHETRSSALRLAQGLETQTKGAPEEATARALGRLLETAVIEQDEAGLDLPGTKAG
jgi:hypothetical protein